MPYRRVRESSKTITTTRRYKHLLRDLNSSSSNSIRLNSLLVKLDISLDTSKAYKEDSFLRDLIVKYRTRFEVLSLLYLIRFYLIRTLLSNKKTFLLALRGKSLYLVLFFTNISLEIVKENRISLNIRVLKYTFDIREREDFLVKLKDFSKKNCYLSMFLYILLLLS